MITNLRVDLRLKLYCGLTPRKSKISSCGGSECSDLRMMKDISQCLLGDESCLVLMLNSLYCVLPHSNFTAQFTQMWKKYMSTCNLIWALDIIADTQKYFSHIPCILIKVLILEQVCLFLKNRLEFLQIFNPNKIDSQEYLYLSEPSEMCSLCACSWLLYGDIYRVTSKLSSALNIQHNNKWHGGRKVTDNLLHGH